MEQIVKDSVRASRGIVVGVTAGIVLWGALIASVMGAL